MNMQKLRIVFINIAIICTSVVFLELGGQFVYRLKKGVFLPFDTQRRSDSFHNQLFELHPYLAGRLKKNALVEKNNKSIKITEMHTRWTGAPSDQTNLIKIAVLGGSTTFGTRVADEDSWPALLQEKLGNQYAVINYGVPGYSTTESVIQMALIIPELKPDFVVFYEGWNDIKNYHERELGPDYYGHGIKQFENLQLLQNEKTLSQKLSEIFVTPMLSNKVKEILSPSKKKANPGIKTFETFDPFVDKIYIRNLKNLKLLSEDIGAYALFIPQILNYSDFEGRTNSKPWSKHIMSRAMPALMDRFNSLMQETIPVDAANCKVVYEVLEESWVPDDFADEGHFSRVGGEKFAEIIANFIM